MDAGAGGFFTSDCTFTTPRRSRVRCAIRRSWRTWRFIQNSGERAGQFTQRDRIGGGHGTLAVHELIQTHERPAEAVSGVRLRFGR
jgi:hypothetical protein